MHPYFLVKKTLAFFSAGSGDSQPSAQAALEKIILIVETGEGDFSKDQNTLSNPWAAVNQVICVCHKLRQGAELQDLRKV